MTTLFPYGNLEWGKNHSLTHTHTHMHMAASLPPPKSSCSLPAVPGASRRQQPPLSSFGLTSTRAVPLAGSRGSLHLSQNTCPRVLFSVALVGAGPCLTGLGVYWEAVQNRSKESLSILPLALQLHSAHPLGLEMVAAGSVFQAIPCLPQGTQARGQDREAGVPQAAPGLVILGELTSLNLSAFIWEITEGSNS